MTIEKIAIVGAGQMGNGIAHVCVLAGYETRMLDVTKEQVAKAMQTIESNMDRQVAKGTITEAEKNAAFGRLVPIASYDELADCDLVIESVVEDEGVKRDILKNVAAVLKPEGLIATNTSSISVTRLGASIDRPGRFMGMHFMNPVPLMKLVELVRGLATDRETFEAVHEVTVKLGKTPVNAEDFPAFMVNRVLLPMVNEAVYTLYEGVGSVESIDTALKLGANHPMGPLELADFIGLDVCLAVMQVLYDGLADSKYRPCPLLVKYVEAGWLGRKAGRGFYDYSGDTPTPTR